MKTKLTLLALLISISAIAQNGINYKALIKDDLGNIMASTSVVIKFQILESDAQVNVYEETHSPTTDDNGIVIVNIGEGIIIGALITALFSLIPLLKVRKVSPLRTLRASLEEDIEGFDPWAWLLYAGIAAALFGFLWWLTGSVLQAGIFVAGLGVAFAVLFLVGSTMIGLES